MPPPVKIIQTNGIDLEKVIKHQLKLKGNKICVFIFLNTQISIFAINFFNTFSWSMPFVCVLLSDGGFNSSNKTKFRIYFLSVLVFFVKAAIFGTNAV